MNWRMYESTACSCDYSEWSDMLAAHSALGLSSLPSRRRVSQNGGAPDSPDEMDSTTRYIRCGRDLAMLVSSDTIYT